MTNFFAEKLRKAHKSSQLFGEFSALVVYKGVALMCRT